MEIEKKARKEMKPRENKREERNKNEEQLSLFRLQHS